MEDNRFEDEVCRSYVFQSEVILWGECPINPFYTLEVGILNHEGIIGVNVFVRLDVFTNQQTV